MAEIHISDKTLSSLYIHPTVDGERKGHGLIPRPKSRYGWDLPRFSSVMPTLPKDQWPAFLDIQKQTHAQLSDIRNIGNAGSPIPSRDQDGKGYCWAHSGVSAHLVARARMGEPYADLSAYAIACIIKNYQDEGGWGSEGVKFQQDRGCPTSKTWPQQSMSRSNDNPNTWADAALHKYVQWVELDHSQMEAQLVTCLLLGIPVVVDYNWWSHSVCAIDVVEIGKTGRIWNSWGDSWSENGTGTLDWNKFVPDDAVACITVKASAA